ncbi:MAG: hypothetical protein ACC628_16870, partial [Pirellulaceae bacterium]
MSRQTARFADSWIALAVLVPLAGVPARGEELLRQEEKPIREIFVPFEDLDVLLEGDTQRVFLTRQQYEELLEKAKEMPQAPAPRAAMLSTADYQGTVSEGRAEITGLLTLDVLEKGLHVLPLELSGVGLRRATLDGRPAALGRRGSGQAILFVEGEGSHELRLDLVSPLATSAAQQTLNFQLPTPAAVRLRLTVPGDIDVRSGAAVVSREVDEQARVTRLELLPQRGPVALVMSLNNRLLRQQRSVLARSVIVDEVTQAYERIHATVSLAVLHGAVDQFRFKLPDGFEVSDVRSPTLARWRVENPAGTKDRVLVVVLNEPTTETVVLNLDAINNRGSVQDWSFPRIEALDVVGQFAVVGLLAEDRLGVDSIASEQLIPIDTQVLRDRLPESVFQADPGAPRLRSVVAFYAAQAAYQLTARFTKPPATVEVVTNLVLTLDHRQRRMRGGFTLWPQIEKLFDVDFSVPEGWHVLDVTTADGNALEFERFPAGGDEAERLQVRLPRGVAPGERLDLFLQATSTPKGWLDDWSETTVEFPAFAVIGAARGRGALAVLVREGLVVRPDQL